jgi:dipeptidyl aminopeptidase/acylaminoacyl peptidase
MPTPRRLAWIAALACALAAPLAAAVGEPPSDAARVEALERQVRALSTDLDQVRKMVDDVLWFTRLADVAEVDKVAYVGPPNPKGEETFGIANERHPFRVYQYVFVPKDLDRSRRHPLLVLPHGGVHGDFGTYHVHIVREMLAAGYVVVAPEYRGSTGYGWGFYEAIDYGGLEVDDVVAGRDWAVATLPFVDPERVGFVDWSRGGLIALFALFDHPEKFVAGYAGVPVSDLIQRLGYYDDAYRDLYSADHHIGKTPNEDVAECRRRSPVWHVDKLKRPLLVHSTTNDRDVNVVEVESLIAALRAAGKDFESKNCTDAPGGHGFNRIDTPFARESRREIYAFLAKYLKP